MNFLCRKVANCVLSSDFDEISTSLQEDSKYSLEGEYYDTGDWVGDLW